jgi:hypothetical protein
MENTTAMVHTVDLARYDEMISTASWRADGGGDHTKITRLSELIGLFDAIVNSRVFVNTSIVLVLCNPDVFRSKLARTPLRTVCPDYVGAPADYESAIEHLTAKFMSVNRMGRKHIYVHVGDLWEPRTFNCILTAVRDRVLSNLLDGVDLTGTRPSPYGVSGGL